MAQNSNGYQNLYIPVGTLEKGVSLRDFTLRTVHQGLRHFSAHKSYNYVACFFWWPQMRQDFIVYCQSYDKYQINNEPTTLSAGRSLTLPDPNEAYQLLAIDFAGPCNKSNKYTTVMVIMERFISYTYLDPLKDATISEKTLKKLQRNIFNVHGLPLNIVLDQDSRFTSKFWSQMMKSLGIQVWMATQSHHQTSGQLEGRIQTLKQMMRNFVNKRQNNWSGALTAIAAAMNGAPHVSLGISPYQDLHQRNVSSGPTLLALVSLNLLIHNPAPRSSQFTQTLGSLSWSTLPSPQMSVVHRSLLLALPDPCLDSSILS